MNSIRISWILFVLKANKPVCQYSCQPKSYDWLNKSVTNPHLARVCNAGAFISAFAMPIPQCQCSINNPFCQWLRAFQLKIQMTLFFDPRLARVCNAGAFISAFAMPIPRCQCSINNPFCQRLRAFQLKIQMTLFFEHSRTSFRAYQALTLLHHHLFRNNPGSGV